MRKELRLVGVSVVISAALCFSQSSGQNAAATNIKVDCSDPFQAASPECSFLQDQTTSGQQRAYSPSQGVPELRAPSESSQAPPIPLNPSQRERSNTPPW